MEENRSAKSLKIWNFVLAVSLIIALVATFERLENGSDFFPVWLIVLCWLLAAISFWRIKAVYDRAHPPSPSAFEAGSLTETPRKSEKEREEEWRRGWELESAASDLIARIFADKKIPLIQIERDRGGHYDGANVYTFGEPLPLTADDLYKLKSNRVIDVDVRKRGGALYLHRYSSNDGRLLYILKEPPESESISDASPVETAAENPGAEEKEKDAASPENKAHAFVQQLCAAKNIRLTFICGAGSGHDPSPETWAFEKPIPLSAAELYALTLTDGVERVDTEMGADNILCARLIWRDDWVVYRFEQR